jgi:hypothetical protein
MFVPSQIAVSRETLKFSLALSLMAPFFFQINRRRVCDENDELHDYYSSVNNNGGSNETL